MERFLNGFSYPEEAASGLVSDTMSEVRIDKQLKANTNPSNDFVVLGQVVSMSGQLTPCIYSPTVVVSGAM